MCLVHPLCWCTGYFGYEFGPINADMATFIRIRFCVCVHELNSRIRTWDLCGGMIVQLAARWKITLWRKKAFFLFVVVCASAQRMWSEPDSYYSKIVFTFLFYVARSVIGQTSDRGERRIYWSEIIIINSWNKWHFVACRTLCDWFINILERYVCLGVDVDIILNYETAQE